MSTHSVFASKLLSWYKAQLSGYMPNVKPYQDLEEFIQAEDITAADEFKASDENSAFTEDLIQMNNALCNQMELRRCMNERDMSIEIYWDRWQRYMELESAELTKFKDTVEAKHAFIKSTSKNVRKNQTSFHGHGKDLFAELKQTDYVKHSIEPDTGRKA